MQDSLNVKKIELQHKKLLAEYNAILIALASVTLGTAGLIYTLTKDTFLSLTGLTIVFFILNSEKESKSLELDIKINEL